MAKFNDSVAVADRSDEAVRGGVHAEAASGPSPGANGTRHEPPRSSGSLHDRAIGDILREVGKLKAEQVDEVLAHQRSHGVRFGESAIALGYASSDDVLFALAQQFHYPYAPQEQANACPELVALNRPFSHQAEAFRAIRSQLIMRMAAPPATGATGATLRRALAVVSPDTGDGKTFFSANLAVALAQLGERTLLVDADLRGPRLHEVFGMPNNAGLSGILSGRSEAQVIQQVAAVPSLYVLPVGVTPPNPLELVERPAFGLLMRELLARFDHVVVDTPAAIYGADSYVIAARCGAALVVARRHASRIGALRELSAVLSESPARLVGVVLNEF
ncbi:polysaccharide biosynthesis tyrosine autokinase [Aquabacterium humicola]|uniref:polysaccharide biosynthesis tyrosine autokinase n=1 Tax=Aquabacterium humicola TaxID=3237377 RepID=UPI002543B79F|nr:polysaccharide biosynthesis tyrosine autokinase [Rubrivivax pictus]